MKQKFNAFFTEKPLENTSGRSGVIQKRPGGKAFFERKNDDEKATVVRKRRRTRRKNAEPWLDGGVPAGRGRWRGRGMAAVSWRAREGAAVEGRLAGAGCGSPTRAQRSSPTERPWTSAAAGAERSGWPGIWGVEAVGGGDGARRKARGRWSSEWWERREGGTAPRRLTGDGDEVSRLGGGRSPMESREPRSRKTGSCH